jgi:UDP-GlcNAc:undecaprenyl-phosphate/decaprenyl-phosphate GlcNAc-1-phosphate transferase
VSIPPKIYFFAAVTAFATVASALPLWRKWCLRTGLVDDPGHRKIHDQPVALAGGLALMTGLLIPLILGACALWLAGGTETPSAAERIASTALDGRSADLLRYGLGRRTIELGGIVAGALGMLWLGWYDDKHELHAGAKFTGQLLIAALVFASGIRITLFVPNVAFSFLITMLWLLTVINAFNFMDNMNGLCAGLGAIGSAYFATFAAAQDQYLVAIIGFLTLGALLGFLPHNFPKARAFLGDAGSHLIGFLLAVLAILPHFYTPLHPRRTAVLIPLLVLAIPLVDLVWVVVLRWRMGQPFYQGDTNHLSHRLVRLGLSRTRAVIVIWVIAAALGACAYLL